ncbi:MAG: hypothetical protein HYZ48_01150 [Chlamydiales bacterium]|nr:hypothetical protein [Chlamydiales bacterium]
MALKETVQLMKRQLTEMNRDLDKSLKGNRSASQRVRTNSVKLAKIAKTYRKESIAEERKKGCD